MFAMSNYLFICTFYCASSLQVQDATPRSNLSDSMAWRGGKHNAQQIQQWYIPNEDLAFMHIGKCAGTSFDSWMSTNGLAHAIGGGIHADMSYINAHVSGNPHVLGFLREPAARAASNILYWNTLEFTQNWKGRNMTLSQILNDPEALEQYAGAYSDGWGGVLWLAGLCPNGWYVHTHPDGNNDEEKKLRRDTFQSYPELAVKSAKEQLERFAWFGLLDQVTESMDMLKWQLDLSPSAPGLAISNQPSYNHQYAVTEDDLEHLRTLLPLDTALYKYAKELFDQRFSAYQAEKAAGHNAKEARAPFPHLIPDEQGPANEVRHTTDAHLDYMLSMGALIGDFASGHDY
jgi:hypothetical protein